MTYSPRPYEPTPHLCQAANYADPVNHVIYSQFVAGRGATPVRELKKDR